MSTNDENIDIRVSLRNELSKPARAVVKSLDDIEKAAHRADKRVRQLEDSLDDLSDASHQASESTSELADSMDSLDGTAHKMDGTLADLGETVGDNTKATEENTKSTVKNTKTLTRGQKVVRKFKVNVREFGVELQGAGRGILGFMSNYFSSLQMIKGILFSEIAPMIPILITGIASLGAAAIALIGPLGKLSSNAALILPLYASLGMMIGTLTMSFGGLGDAVSALSDPTLTAKELNKALEGLGPNAVSFAKALVPITKEFKAIKTNVQETFLSGGLRNAMTSFSNKFLPILNRELEDTAANLSEAGKYGLNAFGQPKEMKAIENVLNDGSKNAGLFGMALTEIGRVLLFITEAAGPQLTRFLTHVTNSMGELADGMDKEKLSKFFEEAGDNAAAAWKGVKNFFTGIKNMVKAAEPLTKHLSGGLGDLMERFAKWTGSDEGQTKMGKFFEDMIPNLDAIGNLIGSVFTELGKMSTSAGFAEFVNLLADKGLPAFGDLIRQLSDGLIPVFNQMGEAFDKINDGNPVSIVQPLIDIFTLFGNAVSFAGDMIGALPAPVRGAMTYLAGLGIIAGQLFLPFKLVRMVFRGVLDLFGKGGGKTKKSTSAFSKFKNVLKGVGKAFSWVWKGISKLFGWFKPLFGWIGKLVGKIGFGRIISILGKVGLRFVAFAGGPVGIFIGAAWLIWDGLKLMYDKFEWFRNGVDTVVQFFKDVWNNFISNWRDNIVPTIGDNINRLVEWFRNIPNRVSEFVTTTVAKFLSFVMTLKTNITNGISTFVGGIVNWFLSMKNGITEKINQIKAFASAWVEYMKHSIKKRIYDFAISVILKFLEIRNKIKGVVDRIREVWNNVVDWLRTNIVDRITGFVKKAVAAFDKIGAGVGTAMDKIRAAASNPVDFVVNTVYNNGIRKMWNKIAETFKLGTLPEVHFSKGGGGKSAPDARNQRGQTAFATGGVLPGYSPGRDIHHFTSPTGGNLHLSGGEAIMRPEFTNAVGGAQGVHRLNAMARAGNLNQAFANGGVTEFAGDLAGKALDGIGKAGKWAWGGIKGAANAVKDFASDPLKTIIDTIATPAKALYGDIPSSGGTFSSAMLEIPKRTISNLLSKVKGNDPKYTVAPEVSGGGGPTHMGPPPGGGSWRRPSFGPVTQRYGVPGVLSGLSHAGIDIAGGGKTYAAADGTVFRTGSGILGGRSGLGIGLSHGGGIFTYYGHNPVGGIQVRPGQKVTAGQHIGYQGATGNVTGTHLHFELHRGGWGRNVNPGGLGVFDTGGWLMPGQQAINMSGRPEPILNGEQFDWLKTAASAGAYQMRAGRGSAGTATAVRERTEVFAPNVNIEIGKVESGVDIERAVFKGIKKYDKERRERK